MRRLIHNLITMRKNRVVNIAVYDCYNGKVKILKNRGYKWLIEIIDVYPCYSCQAPYKKGETMWVSHKDIFIQPKRGKRRGLPVFD